VHSLKESRHSRVLIFIIVLALLACFFITLNITIDFNVFLFLKNLFYLKYLPKLGSNTSFWLLFVVGLLTSIHCMGMCGGLMLTQTLKRNDEQTDNDRPKTAVLPAALYNLGRVISYTIVGAVVGGIGQVLMLSNTLKGIIPIIGGLFMVIMAINLFGIFPVLRRLQIGLPNSVVKKLRSPGNKSPIIVGLLTGLMPCGPLQIVELYALGTRSVFFGAASMFVFSLGTVPGLLAFGTLSTLISKRFTKVVIRASAVLVAILGIVMIGRGFALEGIALPTISPSHSNYVISTVKGNVQTVTTTIGEGSFPPIEVRQGIKVIWTIKVGKDIYCDCNKAMVVPEYHIQKDFSIGDNVVEFTPDKTGDFNYTCWMGMIKSKIKVIPNDASA
jgi:sulfite exporter TauE/SafE